MIKIKPDNYAGLAGFNRVLTKRRTDYVVLHYLHRRRKRTGAKYGGKILGVKVGR